MGSSNLIGNPIGFVNTIGTGMKDFYYEPRSGFMHGPVSGGIGLLRGGWSLLKNTGVGTSTAAGKMASSLSKGALTLTRDEEFI